MVGIISYPKADTPLLRKLEYSVYLGPSHHHNWIKPWTCLMGLYETVSSVECCSCGYLQSCTISLDCLEKHYLNQRGQGSLSYYRMLQVGGNTQHSVQLRKEIFCTPSPAPVLVALHASSTCLWRMESLIRDLRLAEHRSASRNFRKLGHRASQPVSSQFKDARSFLACHS